VGFRVFVSEVALSHALAGYVMNTGNSEIEAVFEGEKDSIQSAIRKCKDGIPSAKVEIVDVNWSERPEGLTTFMIRY